MKIHKLGLNTYAISGCSAEELSMIIDRWMSENDFEKLPKTLNAIEEVEKQPYIKSYADGQSYVVKCRMDSRGDGLSYLETGRYLSTFAEQGCTYIDMDNEGTCSDFSKDIETLIHYLEVTNGVRPQNSEKIEKRVRKKRPALKIAISVFAFSLLGLGLFEMIKTGASPVAFIAMGILLAATVFYVFRI